MYSHGQAKYPTSKLVMSSAERDWRSISAELRTHMGTEGPGYDGEQIEIAFLLKGSPEGVAVCKFGQHSAPVPTVTGTVWVCPARVKADEIRTTQSPLTAGHLYLPVCRLEALSSESEIAISTPAIRSAATLRDDMIQQLGLAILNEMANESAAGRLLIDAASVMLAAWLLQRYAEHSPATVTARSKSGLDQRRLRRVLDYIEQHLDDDISLSRLARVACLSDFHFSRAFSATTGLSPHRYVSQQRLERAMELIAEGNAPLSEIAFRSGFSSQAAFSRAFRRKTGMAPGEYRREIGR